MYCNSLFINKQVLNYYFIFFEKISKSKNPFNNLLILFIICKFINFKKLGNTSGHEDGKLIPIMGIFFPRPTFF